MKLRKKFICNERSTWQLLFLYCTCQLHFFELVGNERYLFIFYFFSFFRFNKLHLFELMSFNVTLYNSIRNLSHDNVFVVTRKKPSLFEHALKLYNVPPFLKSFQLFPISKKALTLKKFLIIGDITSKNRNGVIRNSFFPFSLLD